MHPLKASLVKLLGLSDELFEDGTLQFEQELEFPSKLAEYKRNMGGQLMTPATGGLPTGIHDNYLLENGGLLPTDRSYIAALRGVITDKEIWKYVTTTTPP
jgi:hypothetical protein